MLISCIRRRLPRFLDAHALLDDALHAQQADAELRLDQLTHAAHAAVAEVVDVVLAPVSIVQLDQAAHDGDQIILRQHALVCGIARSSLRLSL